MANDTRHIDGAPHAERQNHRKPCTDPGCPFEPGYIVTALRPSDGATIEHPACALHVRAAIDVLLTARHTARVRWMTP